MNIKMCANGHYYNGHRYKTCPYCEEAERQQNHTMETKKAGKREEKEQKKQEKIQQKEEKKVAEKKKKYIEKDIREEYRKLTELLIERKLSITTMESATSGQIASLITDTEGASAIFKGASIAYSNQVKIMQGVPAEVIHNCTVYSKETASAMAMACANMYGADIGIGVTGTMGNKDTDNEAASVPGEVYFAIYWNGSTMAHRVEIPPQANRLMYKLAVAKEIYDELMLQLV